VQSADGNWKLITFLFCFANCLSIYSGRFNYLSLVVLSVQERVILTLFDDLDGIIFRLVNDGKVKIPGK